MIEWYNSEGWVYLYGSVGGIALWFILEALGINHGDGPGNFPDFDCD